MFTYDKKQFDTDMRKAVEEDIFIETMKANYGVPRPLVRSLISEYGIYAPAIFDELRKLGYPVTPDKEL